ncbi:hypothetical protein Hanom_Chr13g01206961 [Helianthus anomalus]
MSKTTQAYILLLHPICYITHLLPLHVSKDKIKIIKHRHHGDRTQKHKHGTENPKHERKCRVENPVPHCVKRESFL